MALTASEYQAFLVAELNGGDALRANVALIWDRFSRYSNTPEYQYLLAKVSAIHFLLGNLDEEPSFPLEGDVQKREETRRLVLTGLLRFTLDEIKATGLANVPVIGYLEAQGSIPSPLGYPDANDPIYRGDPNQRPRPVILP